MHAHTQIRIWNVCMQEWWARRYTHVEGTHGHKHRTYIYTCIHIYIHTCKYNTYIYICIHIYTCVYINIYIYTYTHMHIYIHIYIHMYTYIYVFINTYIHQQIHIHSHKYIYTCRTPIFAKKTQMLQQYCKFISYCSVCVFSGSWSWHPTSIYPARMSKFSVRLIRYDLRVILLST